MISYFNNILFHAHFSPKIGKKGVRANSKPIVIGTIIALVLKLYNVTLTPYIIPLAAGCRGAIGIVIGKELFYMNFTAPIYLFFQYGFPISANETFFPVLGA